MLSTSSLSTTSLSKMVTKVTLATVVVIMLAAPAHTFFLDNLLEDVEEAIYTTIVKPAGGVLLGGGTGVVYNALSFHFLHPYIERIGSSVISQAVYAISGVVQAIGTIIVEIVTAFIFIIIEIITAVIEVKIQVVYYAFRLLTSFIIPGVGRDFKEGDEVVDNGRHTRSANESVTVSRHHELELNNLKQEFESATQHDSKQCLPLVFCDIYANTDDHVFIHEAIFRKAFRSYFAKKSIPDWAKQYVRAADIGVITKSSASCRESYPLCRFSAYYLRKLIAKAMNAIG
ncbi:uncharacterized protein [Procambarus clarkii]|uniref:uncharacterized protein n=1 Tax=Procambarus clarkii TaxID=6728 RepID=UPI001E6716C1|nr:uncharacterized protein LOC123768678 [Procambarus clarkii]XP_045615313.1 uncharacterized protein LOC123768678 [Procambarus clarkii]XP_045615314.1 uncharacterized protein LOC123768678 [Procambarus clarkii]